MAKLKAYINGYTITYNAYWAEWCVNHPIAGPCYFANYDDAIEYAVKG